HRPIGVAHSPRNSATWARRSDAAQFAVPSRRGRGASTLATSSAHSTHGTRRTLHIGRTGHDARGQRTWDNTAPQPVGWAHARGVGTGPPVRAKCEVGRDSGQRKANPAKGGQARVAYASHAHVRSTAPGTTGPIAPRRTGGHH